MTYISKSEASNYNMVELTRVLHPVGQGGFYTETFKNYDNDSVFKMVYDCGSETNKPQGIITHIDNYLHSDNDTIDAVFVSHLHDDHINGLGHLLSNKIVKVKYLFLPQLTPNVVIEAYLYNYIKDGAFDNSSNDCLTNLINKTIDGTKIIEINEIDGDNGDYILSDSYVNINNELKETVAYNSGTKFTINTNIVMKNGDYLKWLYIPFNSPCKTRNGNSIIGEPFFDKAKDTNGNIMLDKLPDLIKNEKVEKCKQIYEKCFGKKHNKSSMTLFSGIEKPYAIDVYKRSIHCCNKCYNSYSPNFLYTGDFEPNKKCSKDSYVDVIEKHLVGLWETISGIQVPHHGSRDNFNSKLYYYPCRAYISAGSRNTYHHPNVDTLVNIQKECCRPIIVTEDLSSMQIEVYELRPH